jgi:hypothetical protein
MKIPEKQLNLTALRNEIGMIGTPYHNTSLDNAAATITIADPGAGKAIQLNSLVFSYSATPSVGFGLLTVFNGGTIYLQQAVTTSGTGPVLAGIKVPPNTPMTIVLAAGGAGVIGRISASVAVV